MFESLCLTAVVVSLSFMIGFMVADQMAGFRYRKALLDLRNQSDAIENNLQKLTIDLHRAIRDKLGEVNFMPPTIGRQTQITDRSQFQEDSHE